MPKNMWSVPKLPAPMFLQKFDVSHFHEKSSIVVPKSVLQNKVLWCQIMGQLGAVNCIISTARCLDLHLEVLPGPVRHADAGDLVHVLAELVHLSVRLIPA